MKRSLSAKNKIKEIVPGSQAATTSNQTPGAIQAQPSDVKHEEADGSHSGNVLIGTSFVKYLFNINRQFGCASLGM